VGIIWEVRYLLRRRKAAAEASPDGV